MYLVPLTLLCDLKTYCCVSASCIAALLPVALTNGQQPGCMVATHAPGQQNHMGFESQLSRNVFC